MPSRHLLALFAGLSLSVLASACRDDTTAPPLVPAGSARPLGLVEVTISGLGTAQPRANARVPAPASGGARWSLSVPANGNASGNGSIQLQPLGSGSFTTGVRGVDGHRYLWATFRVRNAQIDGTPYDTPRKNLTFFAVSTAGTLDGTAVSSMARFDGSAAAGGIATGVVPTGLVSQSPFSLAPLSASADVLQVIAETEAATIPVVPGASVLPYGFVVRSTTGGRTLAASPAPGQYDGTVTFAFKLPLQPTAADDPFTISAMFQGVDDSEVRVTQSLEEQTAAGGVAFEARAAEIGATMKTALPGIGSYGGDAATTRTLCTVRIAGTSGSPTAYLVNRPIASIELANRYPGWPLWTGGSMVRQVAQAKDGGGTAMPDVPVQMSVSNPSALLPAGNGVVRMVPAFGRTTSTVSAAACGQTTGTLSLTASSFIPIAAGDLVSVAIRSSNGSVVAWGDPSRTTVPAGLTNVVQVASSGDHALTLKPFSLVGWGRSSEGQLAFPTSALHSPKQLIGGAYFSAALQDEGTVVAWGGNDFDEITVPPGLAGVLQIAAGPVNGLALKIDGTVVEWGFHGTGHVNVPAGLTEVAQVAAGLNHSLVLKRDGTVVAWGGDAAATVPAGLTSVVQIASGSEHALALKSDGTVVAWGNNADGKTTVPPGLTGVVHVAAGARHSLALKSDGTIVGWGYNGDGRTTTPPGLVARVP